jgi:ornithine--oxo-acid transaminase
VNVSPDTTSRAADLITLDERWGAHNYHPLPVVVAEASGAWVTDVDGKRYLDCLSAYSALNQGHVHPRILKTFVEQAARVTLTSRAFFNDQLPLFCQELANRCRLDRVLPMNSGAEAVETAIKAARRWAYDVKGVAPDAAEIIVCDNNFHGRTTTIVGFSSDEAYRRGFGPFTPGFVRVPFGDIDALAAAITENTAAFLVEPIQAEAGIFIPPDGYLQRAADVCRRANVLFVADEIQTGLGRTGEWFACDHEGVRPDMFVLGKALSGGFYPVSAVVGRKDVMDVFTAGSHGSTYGGNPLAAAVARTALSVLDDEGLIERARRLGPPVLAALRAIESPLVRDVRGRGLLIGIELSTAARPYCERLLDAGVLCKETHECVIRLAPPLVTSDDDVNWMIERVRSVLTHEGS